MNKKFLTLDAVKLRNNDYDDIAINLGCKVPDDLKMF